MFESVGELKSTIRDEFSESVPDNDKFHICKSFLYLG